MNGLKEMALEAQLPHNFYTGEPMWMDRLEIFAELVRKDYSTTHANIWLDRIHKFILAERERCAKVCDGWTQADGDRCAEAIRALGDEDEVS